jgi:hypothetical protein
LRVLLQALQADRFQVAVDAGVEVARPHRLALRDLEQSGQRRLGPERRSAGQQFVQDRPQAVHVHGRGEPFLRGRLFGGHVAGGADNGARLRQALPTLDALGQAEVGDVRLALRVQEDVGRLEVAVQDAALVREMDRPRHGRQESRRRGRRGTQRKSRERFSSALLCALCGECFLDPLCQATTLNQLHAEIVLPLVVADLVDEDDVRVVQAGGGFGLGAEALHLRRRRQMAREIIFRATTRFRLICRARYTTPMPPRASSSSNS